MSFTATSAVLALTLICFTTAAFAAPQISSQGVALPAAPAMPAYPAPPGSDHWVWSGESQASGGVTCFRKVIALGQKPKSAKVWISADKHYRLYVNGELVARGPSDPGEDYPGGKSRGATGLYFCDFRDIAPYLAKGDNVVAVEVFSERYSDWYGSLGKPGLCLRLRVDSRAYDADATWRAKTCDYVGNTPVGLTHDAQKEPAGWRSVAFNDTDWAHCGPVNGVWPKLQTSQLHAPMEVTYPCTGVTRISNGMQVTPGQPIHVERDGTFALKYDRVLAAYVRIHARGGAGAHLQVALNEQDGPGGHRAQTFILGDGEQRLETVCYSSFTHLNVTVSHVTQPFDIEAVEARFVSQPVAYVGAFECSDPHLNALWQSARWATQICMQDHYLDSPDHQEPISDPGDYMIEGLLSAYAFHDFSITRQDLRKFGGILRNNDYINFHTSYSLLWLQMLLDYYDYTGDAALVQELAPTVYGLLDKFATWRGANGLICQAPDYMFMDWVDIGGIACHHPPAVIGQGYMTAFFYRGLADGIRVAQLMGDAHRKQVYEAQRQSVAQAFNRELWVADKGLYRDGKPHQTDVKPAQWLPADTDIETFSPHVNLLAVLYDLAPRAHQRDIVDRVMDTKALNCQPYFYHFVFAALAQCGRFETYAPRELARWQINPTTGTTPEMWGGGDLSHAWQGTPLYQLSARVLGVTPASPGFTHIAIRPQPCGLQWARGVVPTPHGTVRVEWRREGARFTIKATIPRRAVATVYLPDGTTPREVKAGVTTFTCNL